MKQDILLLERDCPECGVLKAVLSLEAATNDEFRGTDGQGLLVIVSMSNQGSIELAKAFGNPGKAVPLLLSYDGMVIEDPTEIKVRLESQGMTS